jgi:predicted Zn-ribbon and HTH transcriptional regulator
LAVRRGRSEGEAGEPAASADETLRQRIVLLLSGTELTFEELRSKIGLPARRLEDELQHVERSVRRSRSEPRKLAVDPARCIECGFVFRDRAPSRFKGPGRCPRCKSERIAEPRLSIRLQD